MDHCSTGIALSRNTEFSHNDVRAVGCYYIHLKTKLKYGFQISYSWSALTSNTRPDLGRHRWASTSTSSATPTGIRTVDEMKARPKKASKPKFRRSGQVWRTSPTNATHWPPKLNDFGIHLRRRRRRRRKKIKEGDWSHAKFYVFTWSFCSPS